MNEDQPSDRPGGPFYGWRRGYPLPPLTVPLVGRLRADPDPDRARLAQINELSAEEVARRYAEGNRAYVAYLGDAPAGYGWSATRQAEIGGIGLVVRVPADERYLWDFKTLPNSRGQNIYPWLLQAILRAETDADWFWIGHTPDNVASRRGILKAGFVVAGWLSMGPDGGLAVSAPPGAERELAERGARALGLPLV